MAFSYRDSGVVVHDCRASSNNQHDRLKERTVLCTSNLDPLVTDIRGRWPGLKSLDVIFRENANQTRKSNEPKNFGTLLRIVLNILKQDTSPKGSLAKKRRHAAHDGACCEALLFSRA